MLAILDYKAGNQTSVRRALEHLGIPCTVTADPALLESAQGIIFPGVGAAGQAMRALGEAGQDAALRRAVDVGQPLLGICLGCQILLERSEENDTPTLGLAPGVCRRFEDGLRQEDGSPAPVPHMGWNSVENLRSGLFTGIDQGAYVYYVHSFAPEVNADTIATTTYGVPFSAAIRKDNFYGTQFHPEKSASIGAQILQNFLTL